MADGKDESDVFSQFSKSTVEQVANLAQLAAEARRLGLIPEFPRELIEKLDLGGTLLDLFRLQIKHTTAIASILGPQARNLEKLNHWSALISTSKGSAARKVEQTAVVGQPTPARFELLIDNPVDRPQKLSVELNKICCLETGKTEEFASEPENRQAQVSGSKLGWSLFPPLDEVEPHAVRTARIEFKVGASFFAKGTFETTAIVRLSPLGTLHRYQLRLNVTAPVTGGAEV
jgi:hypothetical protein